MWLNTGNIKRRKRSTESSKERVAREERKKGLQWGLGVSQSVNIKTPFSIFNHVSITWPEDTLYVTCGHDSQLLFQLQYLAYAVNMSWQKDLNVILLTRKSRLLVTFSVIFHFNVQSWNTSGLNLASVIFTTVQVSRLPLWPELLVSSRA
jgi:hypothetical protein